LVPNLLNMKSKSSLKRVGRKRMRNSSIYPTKKRPPIVLVVSALMMITRKKLFCLALSLAVSFPE